ncbi:MAG: DMT family transporter [Pseudomonadota bacterium]
MTKSRANRAMLPQSRHKARPGHIAVAGYGWMALAVLIWASWLVLTASGRATGLSLVDLAVFRAAIPTVSLAPVLWRHRDDIARLGWRRCLLLSAYGAPFTLCVGYGLGEAPVAHAGALVPGLMPVFAIALSRVFLDERVGGRQVAALSLILSGAGAIVLQGADEMGADPIPIGHLFFLLGALCWASFTVTLRAVDVSPFLATAIVGAVSSLILVPYWFFSDASHLRAAPLADITFQAVFQGMISGLVSIFAFGRALRLIGGQAAALSALTPGVTTCLAVPVLGQIPSLVDALALVLVVVGLIIPATGAPASRIESPSPRNGASV